MSITNWWPLALLLLVPLILLLYMLKQKAREYPFSSGMLWKEIYSSMEATKPWEKLKKNILMILQILTVLLLILALTAPYLKRGGRSFDHVFIVLDNSASMGIRYNEERTRFEEAKERAASYVDSLSETAQVTILTSNREAQIVKTNVTDKSDLEEAIQKLEVTELSGDTQNAVSVVNSMVEQAERYEAIFMTDQPVDLGTLNAQVINLYTDYQNLSLDYLSYGMEYDEAGNGSLTVIGKLTNDTTEDITTDVNLYGDEKLLTVGSVTVPAAGSQVIYFKDVAFTGNVLMAEINNKDDLLADNKAYAAINQSAQRKALLITQDNVFLEKAIATISWVDMYKTNQVDAISTTDLYDLYIFDGIVPETLPASGNVMFINPTKGDDIEATKNVSNTSLEFANSELTKYVEGATFGASTCKEYTLPAWGTSFVTDGQGTVGYYGVKDGRRVAVLGFDLHQTDLALQAEFPILISNIMDYMMVSTMVPEGNLITGDKPVFNASPNGTDLTIVKPNGQTSSLPAAVATNAFTDTELSGIYEVSQGVGDPQVVRTEHFAVRFPIEQESHVKDVEAQESQTVGEDQKHLTGGRDLKNIIVLILLVLLAVEWFFYVKQH